ncbi:MAG: antibiotic biosynthesis monooxygenase family protein [Bacteroidota bacterium]
MFLRMVTHAIRSTEAEQMAELYHRTVITALRTTPGCAFAALLQNTANAQECISLTIWNTPKDSYDYEESGLFLQLVNALRPFFLESNEWKLELSDNLSLEYTPIQSEPTVERYSESDAGAEKITAMKANPFAVQIFTLSVQEDKVQDFHAIFSSEIHPKFKTHKGFIDLILVRQNREFHIISFWDETVDIQSPSGIHSINDLLKSIYSILPSFIRWKVSHRSTSHTSASSEDIKAAIYRSLVAEWFTQ